MVLSASAGWIGYGGWAYFANHDYGQTAAWRAFLTQGGYSFVVTLVMTVLLENLYRRTSSVVWSAGSVSLLLYASSWSVNWIAGTPEILITILPGAIIGTVYSFSWCRGLAGADRTRAAPPR